MSVNPQITRTGFKGNLEGTASYANTASLSDTASYVPISVRGPEFIEDTRASAVAAFTGVSKDTSVYDGKMILFRMHYAGKANATLNLTLADGTTTGAKNIYFSGSVRLGTQYTANNVIALAYSASVWKVINPYINTTYSRNVSNVAFNGNTVKGNIPVYQKAATGSGAQVIEDSGVAITDVSNSIAWITNNSASALAETPFTNLSQTGIYLTASVGSTTKSTAINSASYSISSSRAVSASRAITASHAGLSDRVMVTGMAGGQGGDEIQESHNLGILFRSDDENSWDNPFDTAIGVSPDYLYYDLDNRTLVAPTISASLISGTASYAISASKAVSATSASHVPFITLSQTGIYLTASIGNVTKSTAINSASYAISSSYATSAGSAISATKLVGSSGSTSLPVYVDAGVPKAITKLAGIPVTASTLESTGDAIINGNLSVKGTTTFIDSTHLNVKDTLVLLASGSTTQAAANGAGIAIQTASATTQAAAEANAARIQYVSSGNKFTASVAFEAPSFTGSLKGNVTGTASYATSASKAASAASASYVPFTVLSQTGVQLTASIGGITKSVAINSSSYAASAKSASLLDSGGYQIIFDPVNEEFRFEFPD